MHKMNIDIEKKNDEVVENQIVNVIASSLNTRKEYTILSRHKRSS